MGKMSDIENINWELFGFPKPGFMPAWRPAEGLMKALAERELPFAQEWDLDAIATKNYLEVLREHGNGQAWCRAFDGRLQGIAGRYLNHLNINLDNKEALTDIPMWTWDDLMRDAADGDATVVADPAKGDLSPEWNLAWLLQRRRAIDLLLYAPVPHKYDSVAGHTHNGIPSSPDESLASAIKGQQPGTTTGGLPSTYVHNIYGPDHGWREGSYCCNVRFTKKIYADIPEGFDPEDAVFLVIKVAGADDSDESFAGGGGLALGVNVLRADADGVFIEFPDNGFTGAAPWPTRDHETRVGWKATSCQAFANYTTLFHFKDGQ